MEKGQMRADVNVSVHKLDTPYGTRAEIKNVNSVRFIGQAIEYEIERQINLLESGGEVDQETRLFDPNTGKTKSMRSKEDAHDYRYFPEPDLPPLRLKQERIEKMRGDLPELPDAKKTRFIDAYKLSPYDAGVLVAEQETAAFYELALTKLKNKDERSPKMLANWLTGELFGALNRDGETLETMKVTAEQLAQLVDLIADDTISGKIAKEYRSGKDKLFGFFVGQVMKVSQGKANPAMVNKLLKEKLV
jgi:aspartyl-tRNA(Asn)/glutamyl-tRNA(Gln) amidotransferase subunit B